jgi:hypothetical protein
MGWKFGNIIQNRKKMFKSFQLRGSHDPYSFKTILPKRTLES